MNTNTLLIGLAAVLAVPTTITLLSEGGNFTELDKIPRLFEGFTADNVKFVVLSKAKGSDAKDKKSGDAPLDPTAKDGAEGGRDEVVLMREGDRWLLGQTATQPNELAGVPVLASRVQNDILDHMGKIRRDQDALVAANAELAELERRGLTEETGTTIQCRNAEGIAIAELIVGKDASGGEWGEDKVKGFFVAYKGRKDIILYENATYWNLSVKPEDWVDTKIHEFQLDKVKTFSLRSPKGSVSFGREEKEEAGAKKKVWKLESGLEGVGAVRQQEVDNLVQRFVYVNCQRYQGSLANPQFAVHAPTPETAEIEVAATLEDGTKHVMLVGQKIPDKNEYHARFEGKDFLVSIGDWMRSPFADKDPKDLFDPASPAGGQTAPAQEPNKPSDGNAPPQGAGVEDPNKKGDGK